MNEEVLVYLFLGFLDSGKTKFIQETLEDKRFDSGEKTLLLICEEGEREYDPQTFAVSNVAIVTLEDKAELSIDTLQKLTEKYQPQRVVIEYNGMWTLEELFNAMPESWVISQIMSIFDATTFLSYNQNMRQQVFDKLQMTQLVVFNRFKGEFEKEKFHKIVRGVSRRPNIVYEYIGGKAEFDDIVDPLPYDINAPVIEIEDRDFAWFYRDIGENTENYIGKTVKYKGIAAKSRKVPLGQIILGRHIMTCCEADIAYDGFAVKVNGLLDGIKTRDWLVVTGKIVLEHNTAYQGKGPVIVAQKLERCSAPEEEVVTYY